MEGTDTECLVGGDQAWSVGWEKQTPDGGWEIPTEFSVKTWPLRVG